LLELPRSYLLSKLQVALPVSDLLLLILALDPLQSDWRRLKAALSLLAHESLSCSR
jgi:hypothetical protein